MDDFRLTVLQTELIEFHLDFIDPRQFDQILNWTEETFGPGLYMYVPDPNQRWGYISGAMGCTFYFRDLADAVLFKLRWA